MLWWKRVFYSLCGQRPVSTPMFSSSSTHPGALCTSPSPPSMWIFHSILQWKPPLCNVNPDSPAWLIAFVGFDADLVVFQALATRDKLFSHSHIFVPLKPWGASQSDGGKARLTYSTCEILRGAHDEWSWVFCQRKHISFLLEHIIWDSVKNLEGIVHPKLWRYLLYSSSN